MKYRIAVVDDKRMNIASLLHEITYSNEVDIVLTANNGKDYLEQMKNLPNSQHPLVVLMDIDMPEMNGIEAVKNSSILYPHIQYIMLTVFDDDDKLFQAIQAGANGYLLKEERGDTILKAIEEVLEKQGAPMSPAIARKALALLTKKQVATADTNNDSRLSEREIDILKGMVNGLGYKEIATKLFISPHTVRNHIAKIYEKLHITSKSQAITLAIKNSWI